MLVDICQLFLSDNNGFGKEHAWANPPRNGRFAIIIDHGKVIYSEVETKQGEIGVSGADAVIAKL